MALIPRRTSAPTAAATTPAASATPPAPAEAATASPAPAPAVAAALASKPPATPDDFAKGVELEGVLVEILKRPETKETVARVAPTLADKAINAAIAYVTNRSDATTWRALVDCTPKSVIESVTKLASVGLCVSQLTGEAFLTPRFSKADKAQVATAIPGVRGMEKLIFESGKIGTVDGNVVRAQDHFVVREGLNPDLQFTRNMQPDPNKANPVIGAYVIVTSTEGRTPKIKTVAIKETSEVKGAFTNYSWSVNGDALNTGRMGIEAAGVYACQRPAMREIARTWLRDDPKLTAMVELEDTSLRSTEELPGAPSPRIRNQRTGPTVAAASTPVAQAQKADPVGDAIQRAEREVAGSVAEPETVAAGGPAMRRAALIV